MSYTMPNLTLPWTVSSYCMNTNCVRVAADPEGATVLLGDTKRPTAEPYRFTAEEWDSFILGAKAGEFDRAVLWRPTTIE